jgi:hypothetical protein
MAVLLVFQLGLAAMNSFGQEIISRIRQAETGQHEQGAVELLIGRPGAFGQRQSLPPSQKTYKPRHNTNPRINIPWPLRRRSTPGATRVITGAPTSATKAVNPIASPAVVRSSR